MSVHTLLEVMHTRVPQVEPVPECVSCGTVADLDVEGKPVCLECLTDQAPEGPVICPRCREFCDDSADLRYPFLETTQDGDGVDLESYGQVCDSCRNEIIKKELLDD